MTTGATLTCMGEPILGESGKLSETIKITAPSHWASYLINGDASGLEEEERLACDAWIEREGLGLPVDCEDAGFMWHHDAHNECPLGADCQNYTFFLV